MRRATRILTLLCAVCIVLFIGTRVAKADDLSISGALSISGTPGSQVFQFSNASVLATTPSPDDALNTLVSFSNAILISATGTQFSPTSGTFSVNSSGCASAGCMSGTVDWLSIAYNGTPSSFTMNVGLTGITGTTGTSSIIDNFLNSGTGNGLLTFQFTAPSLTSVNGLVLNGTPISTTFSATLTTPEPATLGLLGVGLLGLGLIGLSRKKRSEA